MNVYVNQMLTIWKKIPVWVWLLLPILTKTIVYATNRILHADEAALALNIMALDWRQLTGVLDFEQAAPLGFLYVTELITLLFGTSEYALRLFPFLCGIAACVLLYKLCGYLLPKAIPIVMLWFAVNNFFNRYSTEFKQYSVDLMCAILLMIVTYKIIIQKQHRWLSWWTLIGIVAVWFSHASVIVIAGTGISIVIIAAYEKAWRHVLISIFAC